MISIKDANKAEVLATLYNAAKPQGMGFLQYEDKDMSVEEAQELLDMQPDNGRFDYLKGRVMKVNLQRDEFNPSLYNRDNGDFAAQEALKDVEGVKI